MKKHPLISVIMPVYNTPEDFFIPAVKSILNQTYRNIEFIIVDDGSTTNIKEIIDNINNDNIIYINHGHHGAGEARNIGINISTGDYIYIIGSDDTLDVDAIETCVNIIEKYDLDIISFNIYGHNNRNDGTLLFFDHPAPYKIMKPGDATQICRKSIILDNKIKYENLTSCNDVTFTYTILSCAKKVAKFNKSLYHYNMNVPGQISSNRGKKALNIFAAFDALKRNLENNNLFDIYHDMYYKQFCDCVEYEIENIKDDEYKKLFMTTLKEKYSKVYNLLFYNKTFNTKQNVKITKKRKFF